MKARTPLLTVALLGLLVGLSYAAGPAQRSNRGPGSGAALVPLTQTEIDHILYLREEEKMARDVYLALADMWDCPIFTNISASEQRHMDAIERLIVRHGLTDPVTDDTPGALANPELQVMYSDLVSLGAVSLLDALNAGKAIEEQDIADLTVALSEVTAADVTRVFENLLRGSNNHLAAFDRAIEIGCTATGDRQTCCGMAIGAGNCFRDGNGPQGLASQGRARRGKGSDSGRGDGQQSRQRKRNGSCAPTQ
jgi:hypothetical protein